jgi:hypothetical protein
MQFEGISSGMDDYSSGFGVIAEPSQQLVQLDANDSWVRPIASSTPVTLCSSHY